MKLVLDLIHEIAATSPQTSNWLLRAQSLENASR
jgi:hypothetical protein